jgi:hypothetical protein
MTPKNAAAVALGRRGGKARVASQTPEQRKASARLAAQARWAEHKRLTKKIDKGLDRLERNTTRMEGKMEDLTKLNRTNTRKRKKAGA